MKCSEISEAFQEHYFDKEGSEKAGKEFPDLKVHYATFLQACKQDTELLMQETVVCRSLTLRCTLKVYVYVCIC